MGRYTLCQHKVTQGSIPVYKQDGGDSYLYRNNDGQWCVYGLPMLCCALAQKSNMSPSPHKTIPWQYWDNDWNYRDDETLKVYPCYDPPPDAAVGGLEEEKRLELLLHKEKQ